MCPHKAIAESHPSAVYKEDKPLPPPRGPAEALALQVAGLGGGGEGPQILSPCIANRLELDEYTKEGRRAEGQKLENARS